MARSPMAVAFPGALSTAKPTASRPSIIACCAFSNLHQTNRVLQMSDVSERSRDLSEFANAGGQPNQPSGHGLVRPTTGLAERIVGAQQVAVYRDEKKILQKLDALGAAAGDDWFYRFPVKNNRTG